MVGEKEGNAQDEYRLPENVLSPYSAIKKEGLNREINYSLNMEQIKLEILMNALYLSLDAERINRENQRFESIRHSLEIENFFKSLVDIEKNSNLINLLKDTQLDQLKSALEKLNEAIKTIDENLQILAEKIKNEKYELELANEDLNQSFDKLLNYFEKCTDNENLKNFSNFNIDLFTFTNMHLGTFEVDADRFKIIMQDAQVAIKEKHDNQEKIDHNEIISNIIAEHILEDLHKLNPSALIDPSKLDFQNAAAIILNKADEINACDISDLSSIYNQKLDIVTEKSKLIAEDEEEYKVLLQQKNALLQGVELTNNLLNEGKADLAVLKQLTGSIDSLINDLIDIPALTNTSSNTVSAELIDTKQETQASPPRFGH